MNIRNISYRYCTGVSKIDFYPFCEIKNLKKLGYLLLVLKPFIDRDNQQEGILENYSFDPENNSFEATVSLTATWQDGTPVSSFEAAMAIAKGITFREYSSFIRVKGTEDINKPGWETRKYEGVEIISPIKFKLYFETQIDKILGVLEEALSFTAAGNVIWPVRINSSTHKEYHPEKFDLVSKYPIRYENGCYFLNALGNQIELCTSNSHEGFDFYFNSSDFNKYKRVNETFESFNINRSQYMQTFIAIFDSKSPTFAEKDTRLAISSILRSIALTLSDNDNYYIAKSHFERNEPGDSEETQWPKKLVQIPNHIREIKISIPYGSAKNKVMLKFEQYANKSGVNISWIDKSLEENSTARADLQIFIDRIHNNRQIWLQSLLNSDSTTEYLENFPKTLNSLKEITARSAATLPVSEKELCKFELAAYTEISIVPIFRFYMHSFSRKKVPIVLNISKNKELYFSLNKN